MTKSLNLKFERAVRMLVLHMPPSDKNSRKPILFHDIRVGVFLYEKGYSENVVLAGVLHDAIEWSTMSEKMLRDEFGDEILTLVMANTKDDSIVDKEEKTNELVKRCVDNGQDALIVKAADIIDSFKWYSNENNQDELRYCMRNANAIFRLKPNNYSDAVFEELRIWQNKFANII